MKRRCISEKRHVPEEWRPPGSIQFTLSKEFFNVNCNISISCARNVSLPCECFDQNFVQIHSAVQAAIQCILTNHLSPSAMWPHTGLAVRTSPRRHECGELLEWQLAVNTDVLRDKPTTVPPCPPQNPHGLPREWTTTTSVDLSPYGCSWPLVWTSSHCMWSEFVTQFLNYAHQYQKGSCENVSGWNKNTTT